MGTRDSLWFWFNNRQFGEHIGSVNREPKLFPYLPKGGVQHRLVFRVSLSARKRYLPAVHTARLPQNHHQMQLSVSGAIHGNHQPSIYHRKAL